MQKNSDDSGGSRARTPTFEIERFRINGLPFTTRRYRFPAFQGQLDFGVLEPGAILEFGYDLDAVVAGNGSANKAIAAINDPFFLSTDPVTQADTFRFTFTPVGETVPEPGSVILMLFGCGLLVARRLRPPRLR